MWQKNGSYMNLLTTRCASRFHLVPLYWRENLYSWYLKQSRCINNKRNFFFFFAQMCKHTHTHTHQINFALNYKPNINLQFKTSKRVNASITLLIEFKWWEAVEWIWVWRSLWCLSTLDTDKRHRFILYTNRSRAALTRILPVHWVKLWRRENSLQQSWWTGHFVSRWHLMK